MCGADDGKDIIEKLALGALPQVPLCTALPNGPRNAGPTAATTAEFYRIMALSRGARLLAARTAALASKCKARSATPKIVAAEGSGTADTSIVSGPASILGNSSIVIVQKKIGPHVSVVSPIPTSTV